MGNRIWVLVYDDIDISNLQEGVWAMATRVVPEHGVRVVAGTSSWQLDPRVPPGMRSAPSKERGEGFSRKPYSAHNFNVINACRAYEWEDEFPKVGVNSPQLRRATEEKWRELFETG